MTKVSIVMAYYNRLDQIQITLDSINKSSMKNDVEVIIVDDASDDGHLLKLLIYKYNFGVKLIAINKEDKKWLNPCIPYNIGFQHATGDIIIVQNPEICHIGDVIKYVCENINNEKYMVFSVYASPSHKHNSDIKTLICGDQNVEENFINTINYNNYIFDYDYYLKKYDDIKQHNYEKAFEHWKTIGIHQGRSCNEHNIYHPDEYIKWKGWYNHPIHNNRPFHFLSAISRTVLDKIGGFDENFRYGIWYDDNDFLDRIKKLVSLDNIHSDHCYGVHLYHDNGSSDQINKSDFSKLSAINMKIYNDNKKNNVTFVENTVSKNVKISVMDNQKIDMTNFRVALVVKTYSDKDTSATRVKIIEQCITSIKNIEGTADIYIHVDGSHVKPHKRILNRYKEKYPVTKSKINRGIGGICNYAMRCILQKGYDICFMCDDDVLFKKDMITKYCEYILKSGNGHLGYYPSIELAINTDKKQIPMGNTNLVFHKYAYSGCMYSFTSYIIKKIGYLPVFDYKYGYEHEIFSKNYYHSENLDDRGQYDMPDSNNYMSLNKQSIANKSISVNYNKINNNCNQSKNITIGEKIYYRDSDILISVVIPYNKNIGYLRKSIASIVKNSEYYNYELVIVNDQSLDYIGLYHLKEMFYDTNIKLVNVSPNDSFYRNNLLDPYMIGIKESDGKIIVLQTPYIVYNKDLLTHIRYNLTEKQHIVFNSNDRNKFSNQHMCSAFYKDNVVMIGNLTDAEINMENLYDNRMMFTLEKNIHMKGIINRMYDNDNYFDVLHSPKNIENMTF